MFYNDRNSERAGVILLDGTAHGGVEVQPRQPLGRPDPGHRGRHSGQRRPGGAAEPADHRDAAPARLISSHLDQATAPEASPGRGLPGTTPRREERAAGVKVELQREEQAPGIKVAKVLSRPPLPRPRPIRPQ